MTYALSDLYVKFLRLQAMAMTHPTKLTLRLDSGLIESAKMFALDQERSLSQLVADYFARLADQPERAACADGKVSNRHTVSSGRALTFGTPVELSPITLGLRGVLKAKSSIKSNSKRRLGADPDKAAHRKHLAEKYL